MHVLSDDCLLNRGAKIGPPLRQSAFGFARRVVGHGDDASRGVRPFRMEISTGTNTPLARRHSGYRVTCGAFRGPVERLLPLAAIVVVLGEREHPRIPQVVDGSRYELPFPANGDIERRAVEVAELFADYQFCA